ncbi:hypothetical protein Nepgr_031175 [Nepenthes gracilis]|uniref:Lunapark zinc ribbon domain-containing protein n=1 Tax=Nepenthes gracilis TaxID=150966 RepID=A0AAD3TH16_NEPGR|nr:hypothetical protein Nepgr_031175 [Nepenthes gracilis]
MAGETDEDAVVAETPATPSAEKKATDVSKKKEKGLIPRILSTMFGKRNDDFERRLERISKEEASVLSRMRRRSQSSGRMRRHLIIFSVLLEFVAVGFAIMTSRSVEDWKKRAFRVLPMFVLPGLSSATYSALVNLINMLDRKDQKTLEKLRAERQSKIDELKEKTNYYITQQLIQRYDTDPTAKAAAASVLASKLGADSGLKVHVGDDPDTNVTARTSNDAEVVQSSGLRNRKQPLARSNSTGSTVLHRTDESNSQLSGVQGDGDDPNWPVYVDHYQGRVSTAYGGGWFARIAALLVGEDPTQCYALICGNCHMHNGLASKEDFPFVTYICPHCHAVNGPRQHDERASASDAPNIGSSMTAADCGNAITPEVVSSMTADNINADTKTRDSPFDKACESGEESASPAATEGSEKPATSLGHES